MTKQRKIGLLLVLIGIGIPLVLVCFQNEDLEFTLRSPTYKEVERSLTPDEIKVIKELKNKSLFLQWAPGIVEEENTLFGEDSYKEKWIINSKVILRIPYRYFIGIGLILIFVGIGKVILSISSKEKPTKKIVEQIRKSEEE